MPEILHYHGHRGRIRERVLQQGAQTLADYELLEMVLFAAIPRGDSKPLAKSLIKQFKSLRAVLTAPPEKLRELDQVGDAVIACLQVTQEVAGRILRENLQKGPVIADWLTLLDYCRTRLGHRSKEVFYALFLDQYNQLIADEVLQQGTVNQAVVFPREVVSRALLLNAMSIIIVHNHPSGNTTPSRADIEITRQIVQAAEAVGIRIHDHLIVSADSHYSFKSNNLI